MTWNLLGSRGMLVDSVAAQILERDPDAVAIQEIQRRQARTLARHLGWHHRWTLKHFPYSPALWWRAEGLAILSRWELDDATHLRVSDRFWTWNHSRRVLMAATVRRSDDELRLFNIHLGGGPGERIPQVRRVAARLRAEASAGGSANANTSPIAVAGDLNASNDPATLDPLTLLGLRDPGGPNSSPADDPYQRIDYVLIPESASGVHSDTPTGGAAWGRLSDHLPVVVTFAVSIVRHDP